MKKKKKKKRPEDKYEQYVTHLKRDVEKYQLVTLHSYSKIVKKKLKKLKKKNKNS